MINDNIQWDKLTPEQQEIVREVNERHRKKREKSHREVIEKESRDRSLVIKHQKSLMRGDINIREFEIKIQNLGYSPEIISIKLDEIRQALSNHFGINMDKERV